MTNEKVIPKDLKIVLGETYGKRQVIAKGCMNKYSQQLWWVQCECMSDPSTAVRLQILKSDHCRNCAPHRPRKDLVGQTFNSLKVLEHVGSNSNNVHRYRCECLLCGNTEHVVASTHLVRGTVKACSCNDPTVNSERFSHVNVVHGHCQRKWQDSLWKLWSSINTRCSPNNKSARQKYKEVGVCEEWSYSNEDGYMNFHSWITKEYYDPREMIKEGYSIDRIDNNLGYSPSNCRLASRKQQTRNRGCTITYEVNGVKKALADIWEKSESTISYGSVLSRVKAGWSLDDALYTPKGERNPKNGQ